MDQILSNTCTLAKDQYGNYVIQHVLERGLESERQQVCWMDLFGVLDGFLCQPC